MIKDFAWNGHNMLSYMAVSAVGAVQPQRSNPNQKLMGDKMTTEGEQMQTKVAERPERGSRLVFFPDITEGLMNLSVEERHGIVDAILVWYNTGVFDTAKLSPACQLIATSIRNKHMAYEKVCRERSEYGAKGGAKHAKHAGKRGWRHFAKAKVSSISNSNSDSISLSTSDSTSTSDSNSKSTSKMCVPPSREDVCNYCKENDISIDVDAWFDYYEANGWHVGKNPMKDWQASVRIWARNAAEKAKPTSKHCDNYIAANEQQKSEFCNGFEIC